MHKILNIHGAQISSVELENHLEKLAASHSLTQKSSKHTYPIPRMQENFEGIQEVYNMLNMHLKLGIDIHPAGEWLLDNFYAIEETVKQIQKELPIKKYTNFVGVQSGEYQGFARIYVIAAEIVAYTDGKIELESLIKYLQSYQRKKTLSMDEIWNIGTFLEIAIIEKIRKICERVFISQMQKYKVESIIERLIEKKDSKDRIYKRSFKLKLKSNTSKYSFIEYMSYKLKKYGKKAYGYLNVLEETVERTGTDISSVIKKEHFDIALNKVSMGNSITSMKEIQRINFLEIFERINGVEEILKQDPSGVYNNMDFETKEIYRNKIKEISKKTKISEIYIAKKVLEKANGKEGKASHIGYYLIDNGINKLYDSLQVKYKKKLSNKSKAKFYISGVAGLTLIVSILFGTLIDVYAKNTIISIVGAALFVVPVSEVVIQIVQYMLSKIVKPKQIPKLDFYDGIDEQNATMVVIPTIVKSREKVKELMKKLEVFYLANKSENLYFTLLGDCTQSKQRVETFDFEIKEEGLKQVEELNKKYKTDKMPIFNFLYRNRKWNENEGCYLGWERKRGLLTQFNEYILGNEKDVFRVNTIEAWKSGTEAKLPNIKYVITLDCDTDLSINSAFKLIGAMAHILNKPVLDREKRTVIEGHALIQPRVGVNLEIAYKNIFTKLFAGAGGIDCYTNAISDTYQDNFEEGIFTGKGIYDLNVFSELLKHEIPENTVLSHDLLEGSYLRCGLATDILIIDGYPTKYTSFMSRLARWTRGDWQISKWIYKSPLNFLSKYKIFDNLRRSLFEPLAIHCLIYFAIIGSIKNINMAFPIIATLACLVFPFALELVNSIFFKKQGSQMSASFTPKIDGILGAFLRAIITIGTLPYKAYVLEVAKIKTVYRMMFSHKNLLEWTTSEEAERLSKTSVFAYYKTMYINVIFGIVTIAFNLSHINIFGIFLGILWLVAPAVMCFISKEEITKSPRNSLNAEEQEYVLDIAKNTWEYFNKYLNEENNFLIPDNYQEDRIPLVVPRTSSTNIGLSILAIISSYDLKFINREKALELLVKLINTIEELPKWNGHLYNWYNIKTKEALIPKYISTVDSGNFVGYMYVLKTFLENEIQKNSSEELEIYLKKVENIIDATDFSVLYSKEHQLFSIGFNIEENKLTNSYYDLLASEARQASLIAIAKRDIPVKHWNNLSRTMTSLNNKKGLVSWSGTAFEYLMPNINIPKFKGSLLDESSKFLIMSQLEYSKKLGIPWGISEAAFNVKDLHSNYQYKAFGIPWLGLKRGLADEMVVATYGSVLAITDKPKEVLENLKILEKQGMKGKYGFYESIDYTPTRVPKGKLGQPVKTYMAHHQALILLSINNLFNNNILQKRFIQNAQIQGIIILLQERMGNAFITTKENKEKVEKLKYKDHDDYMERTFSKVDYRMPQANVISNADYTVAINVLGEGVSKYKDIYINRYKKTDDYSQGIFFYVKNIQNGKVWNVGYNKQIAEPDKYKVSFTPDQNKIERTDGNIKSKLKTTIAPNEPVEIRRLELENTGNNEEILEVTSYLEPVLSSKEKDYAHPAFNNLFLNCLYNQDEDVVLVKRNKREKGEKDIYLGIHLSTEAETIGDTEYEIDKEKFIGRGNLQIPQMIEKSIPFSKKAGLVTEMVVALKKTIKIKPGETAEVDLKLAISHKEDVAIEMLKKYNGHENVKRIFDISKARVEAESRYLGIKAKDIETYQKMLTYIIFDNPLKKMYMKNLPIKKYKQSDLWKYGISGDLPIILVKIKDVNDIYVVKQILKAYEFFRSKNVEVELVILDEEKHSYENYVKEEIEWNILNNHISYMQNVKAGIFVLNKEEINKNDIQLLECVSSIIIDSHMGNLENNIQDLEEEYLRKFPMIAKCNVPEMPEEKDPQDIDILQNSEDLKYYNEYGAFSNDGKEYLIRINKGNRTPTVWAHIMANKKFGTVVTENMGGYTWYKNSRLNRISSWTNYATLDIPSEVIYLKDEASQKIWSVGCNPMPDDNNYNITYGFGYAKYEHQSNGIVQELNVFVPKDDAVKVNILKLKNITPTTKNLKIYYYTKPVLAEDELKSNGYLNLKHEVNANAILLENVYNEEFENNVVFVSSSENIKSYTGAKNSFFECGGPSNPEALHEIALNQENSLGQNSCVVIEISIKLESFEEKEISLNLGASDSQIDAKAMAYKYSKISNCNTELAQVKNYWSELLERVHVETPYESINIMLNGWAIYQTISSRLLARSGFYQSGGAYGFRDQLQDTLALKYFDAGFLKEQIIKHSKHQFIEGDVEHWWHDETERGIRTRFSDDRLWLVYLTIKYVEFTGDYDILDIETNYIKGNLLEDAEDERYDKYEQSEKKESIYFHCIRAIEKSLNLGENGLPKIGSGDWNDSFSTVGNKGKGESVWLGFFLYAVLEGFIKIATEKGDTQTADRYEKIKSDLKKALNSNGWDGRWFKRAFMDDGNVLGSMENDECRIDSIAQSWSVISDAGDNDKKYISMESLEKHLVDREIGIIKLLDPPFKKSKLEPGYIKAYMPGARENGGQYTHAAIWAVIAETMLGFGDKAIDLYKMITPIEHARTKDAANKYKVEPYVIPADIYGNENLAGRGGWTWYTGSASWYFNAGIEYILGIKIEKGILTLSPCIPSNWKEYSMQYKWGNSIYNIKIKNPNNKNTGVSKVLLDGNVVENKILLDRSGKVYNIEVEM